MRHLFVPACLCLATLSGPLGPDTKLPLADFSTASIAKEKAFPEPAPSDGGESTRVKDQAGDSPEVAMFSPDAPRADSAPVELSQTPLPPIPKPVVHRSREEICDTLTEAAQANDVPVPFFIRLIFQESGFRPDVVSPAGAEGIAQFMPETSADMGLDNPFDPLQAIRASARLLRGLAHQFGNLGLAAAAYNAGPKRIENWLAKKGKLPQETIGYVQSITGRAAENWIVAEAGSPAVKLPRRAPCQEAAGLLAWNGPEHIPLPPTRTRTRDTMTAMRAKITHAAKRTAATVAADKPVKAVAAAKAVKPAIQLAASKPKHRKLQISQR
jgi:hypothetical protein